MLSFDESDKALVQTCDFIMPNVDEPYFFGRIAAANSLSDIYAMNGDAFCAMNILGFPCDLDTNIAKEIMQGSNDVLKEAGVLQAGGHSINSKEPFFGLSVSGFVEKNNIWHNNKANIGDAIIITKPIGTGILTLGLDFVENKLLLYKSMCELNKYSRDTLKHTKFINSATDITGFGLLGHLFEMCEQKEQKIGAKIYCDKTMFLPQTKELFNMGMIPSSAYKNYEYLKPYIDTNDDDMALLLSSSETSGGLMLATSNPTLVLKTLSDKGIFAKQIGNFIASDEKKLKVIV